MEDVDSSALAQILEIISSRRGWSGDSGANVRDIALLSSPAAGLVILCIYIPLNLLS